MKCLTGRFETFKCDLLASLVVFLVALPLCLGIALASGASPLAGIISGVIGGLVVAPLGGNWLQVSGPANGLIVMVLLINQQYGAAALGPIVLAAGIVQLAAATLRWGKLFRALPPATIQGMMAGFAVIIFSRQFHVMLDDPIRGSTLENLLYIPHAVWAALVHQDGSHRAAAMGVLTIVVLLGWKHVVPARLAFVPASLVAVVLATLVAASSSLPVARIELPESFSGAMQLLDPAALLQLREWPKLQLALIIGFLASAETLLSAAAIERLHPACRTQYNRELAAQGVGNVLCGVLGAVPLTGVIIRSTANLAAGARTRLSSTLHGLWLLVLVAFAPGLLKHVPLASLAAVLVVAVFKLIDMRALREMWQHNRRELVIYAVTAVSIVCWGVLPGILLGLGLALLQLLHTLSNLSVRLEHDPQGRASFLYLTGSATFVNAPKLASVLEHVPQDGTLHVELEDLKLIDHACLELLLNWQQRYGHQGARLMLDWSSIAEKYVNPTASLHMSARPSIARPWRRWLRRRAPHHPWQLLWTRDISA
ncbi:MAG: STAS domain-containing protein [Pirellulales bacterium]|nr:STAS domain-containing protein [Pirellulales bacterium]